MPRFGQIGLDGSIAATLGMLYERKERGTTLIRDLEEYNRFKAAQKPLSRVVSIDKPIVPQQELERLRLRRAALEQVIRSVEAYSAVQAAAEARH